jgi:hypothetical protein
MTAMLGGVEPVSGENITGRMQFRVMIARMFYKADGISSGRSSLISRDKIELIPISGADVH